MALTEDFETNAQIAKPGELAYKKSEPRSVCPPLKATGDSQCESGNWSNKINSQARSTNVSCSLRVLKSSADNHTKTIAYISCSHWFCRNPEFLSFSLLFLFHDLAVSSFDLSYKLPSFVSSPSVNSHTGQATEPP